MSLNLTEMPNYNNDPKILEKFGRDLVAVARAGKMDPIIGRDADIREVEEILSRKTKNNPVLIGLPGVGKTAIVEGLAQRIVRGEVPSNLQDKIIFELDMGALIAGAKFQGEFEERLKAVINKVQAANGKIIMFIDELHNIVGAGRTQGAMDASNLLKPLLARGELRCIGATTLDEYRQYIEKDAALERRFRRMLIQEPSLDGALTIVRGLKERYEAYHGVKIHDSALRSAVYLSNKYITDRYLPDKAIDLIDEACASIRLEIASTPAALDTIRRKVIELEMEKAVLNKEKDAISIKRLKAINEELTPLLQQQTELQKQWNQEKQAIDQLHELKNKIEENKLALEQYQAAGNYQKAGELQYSVIPKIEKELAILSAKNQENRLLKEDVVDEDIANIVAKWTGIPVNRLLKSEKEKLIQLPLILSARVKGQNTALKLVSDALVRSRAGIKAENRPIGSFIFLGTTGIGKTEVARTLAETLFDSEKKMIRLDMSEFMERHAVSKLIGSPPGYVGYEQGGQLTERVRRNPYSIILFDEIEKAHADVINILLQILDDGRITDNQGKLIDFKNTIIIMTSNLGSERLLTNNLNSKIDAVQVLKRHFSPEFVNRIDEVVVFNPLTKNVIKEIIHKELDNLLKRVYEIKQTEIFYDEEIVNKILNDAYEPEFGARPIKRYIQDKIETLIAQAILKEELKPQLKLQLEINFKTGAYILSKNLKQKLN